MARFGKVHYHELVNLGARWQMGQHQLGAGGMYFNLQSDRIITVSVDHFKHFAGKSSISDTKPIYRRTNLNFVRSGYYEVNSTEGEIGADAYLNLSLRFGRELNITRISGFAVDIGPGLMIPLVKFSSPTFNFNPIEPFFIGASFTFFLKLDGKQNNDVAKLSL